MKRRVKQTITLSLNIIGTLIAVWVSFYYFLYLPVTDIWSMLRVTDFSMKMFVLDVIKIVIASTVGGTIWVFFDLIAGYFREYPEEND